MSDGVAEQVITIIASVKHLPRERVLLDSTLQDLGMDSLDSIVLLSELEDRFRIAIPDDDARSIRSVRDMVEGVKRLATVLTGNSAPLAE